METLKIEIPKGHEVESFDKTSGVIKFKETPKKVTERIKTIKDVLKDNGTTKKEFFEHYENLGLDEDEIYYILLKLIVKSLNEGWTPNWDDSSEYKYTPWLKMGSSGFRYYDYDYWNAHSIVGSRLCFKSRELAQYAAETFTDAFKKFMIFK